jgi:hypothetical protein
LPTTITTSYSKVHIAQPQAGDLGAPAAAVEKEEDQRAVAAGLEVPAGVGRQEPAQHVLGEHRDGLLGYPWRLHRGHRVGGRAADGLQVGLDRAGGLVLGAQVALEGGREVYARGCRIGQAYQALMCCWTAVLASPGGGAKHQRSSQQFSAGM